MVRYPPSRCTLYLLVMLCSAPLWIQASNASAPRESGASPSRIQMISSLARAGRPEAQYALGRLYLSGQGMDRDPDRGLHWLRKAAEQDHAASQNQLGLVYTGGYGIAIDCHMAAAWFARIPPNSTLYPQAQGNMAWILATCPDSGYRDGQRALKIVQRLMDRNAGDNPLLLDTLAAAYAETGQFRQAVDSQQRALKALDAVNVDNRQRQRFVSRLQSYQKNQPWRLASSPRQDDAPLN